MPWTLLAASVVALAPPGPTPELRGARVDVLTDDAPPAVLLGTAQRQEPAPALERVLPYLEDLVRSDDPAERATDGRFRCALSVALGLGWLVAYAAWPDRGGLPPFSPRSQKHQKRVQLQRLERRHLWETVLASVLVAAGWAFFYRGVHSMTNDKVRADACVCALLAVYTASVEHAVVVPDRVVPPRAPPYCTSLVSPYASLLRLALGLRVPNSYVGLAAYVVLLARPELPPAVVFPLVVALCTASAALIYVQLFKTADVNVVGWGIHAGHVAMLVHLLSPSADEELLLAGAAALGPLIALALRSPGAFAPEEPSRRELERTGALAAQSDWPLLGWNVVPGWRAAPAATALYLLALLILEVAGQGLTASVDAAGLLGVLGRHGLHPAVLLAWVAAVHLLMTGAARQTALVFPPSLRGLLARLFVAVTCFGYLSLAVPSGGTAGTGVPEETHAVVFTVLGIGLASLTTNDSSWVRSWTLGVALLPPCWAGALVQLGSAEAGSPHLLLESAAAQAAAAAAGGALWPTWRAPALRWLLQLPKPAALWTARGALGLRLLSPAVLAAPRRLLAPFAVLALAGYALSALLSGRVPTFQVHALLLALGVPQMGFTEAPPAAPSAVHAVSIALAAAVMLATLVAACSGKPWPAESHPFNIIGSADILSSTLVLHHSSVGKL